MEQPLVIQGRQLREPDLGEIRRLIAGNPAWSRRRISVELAEIWDWRTDTGQLKDMATRSLLLKLERRGMLTLPPRRRRSPRRSPIATAMPDNDPAPSAITAGFSGALQQ